MNKAYENVNEEIVKVFVDILLHGREYQCFCNCDECKNKIISYCLNHLPSYYVSNEKEKNDAYSEIKTASSINEINKQIIKAFHEVGNYANHTQSSVEKEKIGQ